MTDEAMIRFQQTLQLRQFAKALRTLGEQVAAEHYAAEEGLSDYRQAVEALNEKLEEARNYIRDSGIEADLDGLADDILWPELDNPEVEEHAQWLSNVARAVATSGETDE